MNYKYHSILGNTEYEGFWLNLTDNNYGIDAVTLPKYAKDNYLTIKLLLEDLYDI